jgi:HK97 gp10 family phage protein
VKVTATVQGLDQFLAQLEGLSSVAQSDIIRTAVMDGAYITEREAKRIVPVDTGNLKNSIRSEIDEVTHSFVSAVTGTNVEYAPYVELGTSRQSAKPYLRPAQDTQVDQIKRAIETGVLREIARHTQ